MSQRSPPPTWGGIGWGVDDRTATKRRTECRTARRTCGRKASIRDRSSQRSPPPTWRRCSCARPFASPRSLRPFHSEPRGPNSPGPVGSERSPPLRGQGQSVRAAQPSVSRVTRSAIHSRERELMRVARRRSRPPGMTWGGLGWGVDRPKQTTSGSHRGHGGHGGRKEKAMAARSGTGHRLTVPSPSWPGAERPARRSRSVSRVSEARSRASVELMTGGAVGGAARDPGMTGGGIGSGVEIGDSPWQLYRPGCCREHRHRHSLSRPRRLQRGRALARAPAYCCPASARDTICWASSRIASRCSGLFRLSA